MNKTHNTYDKFHRTALSIIFYTITLMKKYFDQGVIEKTVDLNIQHAGVLEIGMLD